MLNFAERQVRRAAMYKPTVEKRSEPRRALAMPTIVQPLGNDRRPLGDPFAVVTRDISPRGLGLIFEDWPEHDLFAVQLSVDGKDFCLLVKTLWHEPMGPFEYAGFRILKPLKTFPKAEETRRRLVA